MLMHPYQKLHHWNLERPTRINCISFSETGDLAVGTQDNTLEVWDGQSGDLLHRIQVEHPVTALAWDASVNSRIFIGHKNGLVLYINQFKVPLSHVLPP